MIQRLPWDELTVPTSDLNRILAAPDMASPASWAVDKQGRRLFVVELAGEHRERYERDVVRVHGISIDLRSGDRDGHQLLVMTLESEQNSDLFSVLCKSLVGELVQAKSSSGSLDIVLNHLRRWKAFLANRNARLLTAEEMRGLFAELWFLIELSATPVGPDGAVLAWHGPDRVQQDFIFGNQAVEVKSLIAADPRTVRISSENQLDSTKPRLHLVTILIADSQDPDARSLNNIAKEVSELTLGPEGQFQLESKLAQSGYVRLDEYDRPLFRVIGAVAYQIEEGFPRIVRSALPLGVVRVTYQIQLEHLEPFKCELRQAMGVV